VLLAEVAPELSEWAAFFASGASKRAAAEAGSVRAVTEREADDLVREADRFLAVVEQALGLAPHVSFEQQIPWRGGAAHPVGRGGAAHPVGRGGAAHAMERGGVRSA
jgi:hypothetical protein